MRAQESSLLCPQSRHSGFVSESVTAAVADGRVRILAQSPGAGAVIMASADCRYVLYVGYPEYETERLQFEYQRDRAAGRPDVGRTHNYDPEHPRPTWGDSSARFFRNWFDSLSGVPAKRSRSS